MTATRKDVHDPRAQAHEHADAGAYWAAQRSPLQDSTRSIASNRTRPPYSAAALSSLCLRIRARLSPSCDLDRGCSVPSWGPRLGCKDETARRRSATKR